MVIEYVEGWLNGRGAKGIDSLEGKPGVHPALMEDLATGRMSVAQVAQRVRHRARTTDGPAATHDFPTVKRLLQEELDDILSRWPKDAATQERYRKATKIALRWIKNYTDLEFRSLGSYTRADLDRIAAEPDAF
jgi:malate synthase